MARVSLEITPSDKPIDHDCGTDGFPIDALRQFAEKQFPAESEAGVGLAWLGLPSTQGRS